MAWYRSCRLLRVVGVASATVPGQVTASPHDRIGVCKVIDSSAGRPACAPSRRALSICALRHEMNHCLSYPLVDAPLGGGVESPVRHRGTGPATPGGSGR